MGAVVRGKTDDCPPTAAAVIDLQATTRLLGCDVDLVREIAGLFVASYRTRLAELWTAVARHDAVALGRVAHSLKGSLGNFAAVRAVGAAARVERIAQSGDLTAAPKACAALEWQVKRVVQALTALS